MLKGRCLDAKAATSLVMAMLINKREPDYVKMIRCARTSEEEIRDCYKLLKEEPIFKEPETRIMPADIVRNKSQQLELQPEVK